MTLWKFRNSGDTFLYWLVVINAGDRMIFANTPRKKIQSPEVDGCRIRVVGVSGERTPRREFAVWYGEAVKLPGSFFELVWYHASGRLLTSYPRLNDFLEKVKRGVLVGEGV